MAILKRKHPEYLRSARQRRQYMAAVEGLYGVSALNPCQDVGTGQIVPPRASGAVPRRTPKPRPRKEWYEQEEIYQWTQMQQPLKGHVMMIGNEGRRNVVQAAVSRRMGLLAGASDLFIARPVGSYSGLWIEVKQNRSYSTAERRKDSWLRQEAFQERMRSAGYATGFAFGAEHGILLVRKYLGIDA